ncbi:CDAN1-interacting nuclease 1 [Diorhabda sublineata]|uniref:CDAN1-interacting nuclease 1 n=1 Tax=Diorhabda sublineata TaxID=1163346 RepID=UPI0024E08893|nr:CDAN1-interacting nuclease 1 [Diorhabda sublineata]
MNLKEYNDIVSTIKNFKGLTINCLKKLVTEFPSQSYDTLYSILQFEFQKRMKINHPKTQSNKQIFWDSYQESVAQEEPSGIIVRIAEKFDVAPCLVAKIILNKHFEQMGNEQTDIACNINIYMRDTALITDPKLAYEVFLCTLYDNVYSPITDVMKSSLGQQYEIKLYREATQLGLGFRDEEQLRKHGYDKTPDCKLEVPISINGFVINWIESKALFGDPEIHKEYMKNQYLSYWNRFGPGLVIYWFGFLDTILKTNDKRYIIRDHLPKNFVQIPPPNFDL